MRYVLKTIMALVTITAVFLVCAYLFGSGKMRFEEKPLITALAYMIDNGGPEQAPAEEAPGEDAQQGAESPEQKLLPYPQTPSMFPDMDMQYAYLLIQQGLERSNLKNNAVLSLENGNEFVIRCWSAGTGLDITEALADNGTRKKAWQDTVDRLWDLDAILSRDIKETLGTDKSVTFQIIDDVHPEAVLLKIKDGCIEYDLFRDGTAPEYEVYRGY